MEQTNKTVLDKMEVEFVAFDKPVAIEEIITSTLSSHDSHHDDKYFRVRYFFPKEKELVVGKEILIHFASDYQCLSCGRKIKKIFDGFCYPCLQKKASADRCITSPHLCHYMQGTCREPQWGEDFCYKPHVVYISFTDKFKVGITRMTQVPIRWIDQGATVAAIVAVISSRHQAGVIEKFLMDKFSDKTHWQKMLKILNGKPEKEEILRQFDLMKNEIQNLLKEESIYVSTPEKLNIDKTVKIANRCIPFYFTYDYLDEPLQFQSLTLEKKPLIKSKVLGIKGQYVHFSDGVFNMRRHQGFVVDYQV